jgi:hypothetical protein
MGFLSLKISTKIMYKFTKFPCIFYLEVPELKYGLCNEPSVNSVQYIKHVTHSVRIIAMYMESVTVLDLLNLIRK